MPKKHAMDKLGDAYIPSDLLTHSDTTNFGLDGFDGSNYGLGNLERVLNAEDTGDSPGFPTGITRGAAADMDLTEMMSESLSNLDWLDPTQLQDGDRLPKDPTDQMIPELVEAWGIHRRTDGQAVVARDLNRARYEASLKDTGDTRKATADQMRDVVAKAMRRSAAGQDIKVILKDATDAMGEEAERIVAHLKHVQAEHGLAGNVFIRAAAYPGYAQGRWGKVLKKLGARYVIVSERQLKTATWIQDGRCTYTGKWAVTAVPWKQAFDHYAPRFESRVAAKIPSLSGTPKERLQQAFLMRLGREASETNFPIQPAQRMATEAEVREHLASRPTAQQVIANEKGLQRRIAKVSSEIQRGLSGDLLRGLMHRTFQASEMRQAVRALAPLIKKHGSLLETAREASYQGAVFTHAAGGAESRTAGRALGQVRAAVQWIRRAMSEGAAGNELDSLIEHRISPETKAAGAEAFRAARAEHEGGSGFIYVDAAAYASPTGRKGCEDAALKHRANQIKAVAEMSRCASCASVRVLEDGTRKCGVYNKLLLASPGNDPDFAKIKRANIRTANLEDSDLTQSIFGTPENAYDPDEFRLANDVLEDIELDLPEHDQVRAVLGRSFDFEV